MEHLHEVFTRIGKANLKFTPKMSSSQERSNILGHLVSAAGIATCEDKVGAVKEWPVPTCIKELKSFLRLASYYRRFIQSFSSISAPLNKLTQKHQDFIWNLDCQKAFDTLKESQIQAPILGFPNAQYQYFLDCDASSAAIGAVLSLLQNGQERVIAYFSKTMNKAHCQDCVTRRELLAIVESVKFFHQYLYGGSFIVRTVYCSIQWLRNFKNPF